METATLEFSTLTLSQTDRAAIWHPFNQMLTARDFIPIVRAKGSYLYAKNGNRYLDATSSWWVNLHGHSHPHIIGSICNQASNFDQISFADFTHHLAIDLASRLLKIIPGKMTKAFYSDNGSTSVEVAIKMALQYWYNQNPNTRKTKVICFKGSYHGETFGAMATSGKNVFNRPFWSHLFEVDVIDPPFKDKKKGL